MTALEAMPFTDDIEEHLKAFDRSLSEMCLRYLANEELMALREIYRKALESAKGVRNGMLLEEDAEALRNTILREVARADAERRRQSMPWYFQLADKLFDFLEGSPNPQVSTYFERNPSAGVQALVRRVLSGVAAGPKDILHVR